MKWENMDPLMRVFLVVSGLVVGSVIIAVGAFVLLTVAIRLIPLFAIALMAYIWYLLFVKKSKHS